MSYAHITSEQRVELGALLVAKIRKKDIAAQLHKHRTSIWRERLRNKTTGTWTNYHARRAKQQTTMRRMLANQRFRKIERDAKLRQYILRKLKRSWTPEQIAGTKPANERIHVPCHETIYQYIYKTKPAWTKYLRYKKNKFRRRHGTKKRCSKRESGKKKRIDTRPNIVETRTRVGDWEGDTMIGKEKTKAILTYVERKSGILRAAKLECHTAQEVREKTKEIFNRLPKHKRHTLTYDNGTEFSSYELIAKDTKLDIYFAYPYHSWERGLNENTNGLLRQFFPKGTSFADITQKQLDRVVKQINMRPRKRHQYKTPIDVFNE